MKRMKHCLKQAILLSVVAVVAPAALGVSDGSEEASAGPGPIEMVEIMNAHVTAGQLYRKKKYAEAVEHLEIAAKGGMKRSQAQLGAILLGMTGTNDVPRDPTRGVGWLGVAAHGVTEPAYRKEYQRVYNAISEAQHPMIDKLVDTYVAKYGQEATRVSCEQTRRAGSNVSRLICSFDDLHKYRDQLDAKTFGALSADGQITDYSENYRSGGFGGAGGGAGGGGGGGPAGGGGGGPSGF